jgi:hypothetical protein
MEASLEALRQFVRMMDGARNGEVFSSLPAEKTWKSRCPLKLNVSLYGFVDRLTNDVPTLSWFGPFAFNSSKNFFPFARINFSRGDSSAFFSFMILRYQPLQRDDSTLLFSRKLVPILKSKRYFIMEFSLFLLLLLLLFLGRFLRCISKNRVMLHSRSRTNPRSRAHRKLSSALGHTSSQSQPNISIH